MVENKDRRSRAQLLATLKDLRESHEVLGVARDHERTERARLEQVIHSMVDKDRALGEARQQELEQFRTVRLDYERRLSELRVALIDALTTAEAPRALALARGVPASITAGVEDLHTMRARVKAQGHGEMYGMGEQFQNWRYGVSATPSQAGQPEKSRG